MKLTEWFHQLVSGTPRVKPMSGQWMNRLVTGRIQDMGIVVDHRLRAFESDLGYSVEAEVKQAKIAGQK